MKQQNRQRSMDQSLSFWEPRSFIKAISAAAVVGFFVLILLDLSKVLETQTRMKNLRKIASPGSKWEMVEPTLKKEGYWLPITVEGVSGNSMPNLKVVRVVGRKSVIVSMLLTCSYKIFPKNTIEPYEKQFSPRQTMLVRLDDEKKIITIE